MSGIRSTLSNLRSLRRKFDSLLSGAEQIADVHEEVRAPAQGLRHALLHASNPGDLGMHVYVPSNLPRRPGLVVVLHGCDQTVQSYDRGSGWSRLAERDGFVVLYPEQKAANNAKCCFSWFLPGDVTRGQGEVRSIIQMIEQVSADHNVDQSRIFVTGLSAGGAMTAALLATYPEKFAGGAIIGGIPYGSAHSVQEAFECMFSDRETAPRILGDRVRAASEHRGQWPRLSIWHGSDDPIVRPSNAEECVRQWTNVHGLTAEASRFERIGRHTRRVWKDSKGRERLEAFTLAGMGHGVPVHGSAGHVTMIPFFLDVGLSSTHRIAEFWGLIDLAIANGATVASAAPRSRRIITVG